MPFRYASTRGSVRRRHRRRSIRGGTSVHTDRAVAPGARRTSALARGRNKAASRSGSGTADDPAGAAGRASAAVLTERARGIAAPRPGTAAPAQALTRPRSSRVSGDREEQPGATALGAVDGRDGLAPSPARAQPFDLDGEIEAVAGTHEPAETNVLDPTEQWELPGVAGIREQRDRARLRECLELQHTGEDRIPREVSGEEGLVTRDEIVRAHSPGGVTRIDAVDETKRRTVW